MAGPRYGGRLYTSQTPHSSGAKRTSLIGLPMSADDPKRTLPVLDAIKPNSVVGEPLAVGLTRTGHP